MAVGFTVIVKLNGVPAQLLAVGVTVITPVIGEDVVLVPAKDEILPVPLAARPIDVLVFDQLYVAPLTALLKLMADTFAPLHTV